MWAWDTGWLGFDKGEEERGTFIHWFSVWDENTGRKVLCTLSICLTDVGVGYPSRAGQGGALQPRHLENQERVVLGERSLNVSHFTF